MYTKIPSTPHEFLALNMYLLHLYIFKVMAVHKDAKYLHIGCDEVYHLGTCQPCLDQPR